ncbi:MAG: hypothetical protein RSD57_00730 [Comamonas sp.]
MATISMDEYAGGRSIGGVQQPAQLRSNAGDAQLEFTFQGSDDKPTAEWLWWTVGTMQLAQETPVRIRRLQLDRPGNFEEEILGQWYLPAARKMLTLTRAEGDVVTTADGSVICSR